jgi:hypothetical protein
MVRNEPGPPAVSTAAQREGKAWRFEMVPAERPFRGPSTLCAARMIHSTAKVRGQRPKVQVERVVQGL